MRLRALLISTLPATLMATPAFAQSDPVIFFQNGTYPAVIRHLGVQWAVEFPLPGTSGRDQETVEAAFERYIDVNRGDPEALLKGVKFLAQQTAKRHDLELLIALTPALFRNDGEIDLGRATLAMIEANDYRTAAAMGVLGMILCSHSPDDVRLDAAERIARTKGSLPKQEFTPSILARTFLDGHETSDLYKIWVLTGYAFGIVGRETAATFLAGGGLPIGELEILARFAAENHHPSSHTRNLLEETALRYILEEGLHEWPRGEEDIRITYSEYHGFETWYSPNFVRVLEGRTTGPDTVRLMNLLALFRMKEALATIRDGLTHTDPAIQGGAFEAAVRSVLWGEVRRADGELSDLDPSRLIRKGAWISSKRVFTRYFKAALAIPHDPADSEPPRVFWPVQQVVESRRLNPEKKTELLSEFLLLAKEAGNAEILFPLVRLDVAELMVGHSQGVQAFTEIVLHAEFEERLLRVYPRPLAAEIEQEALLLIIRLRELKSKPAGQALGELETRGWVEPQTIRSRHFAAINDARVESARGVGKGPPLLGKPISKDLRDSIVKEVKARARDGYRP